MNFLAPVRRPSPCPLSAPGSPAVPPSPWPWRADPPLPELEPPFTLGRLREQIRRLTEAMSPWCLGIYEAGPLRRHRLGLGRAGPAPFEFVVVPRHETVAQGEAGPPRDLLRAGVERWLVRGDFFMPGTTTRAGQCRYHLFGPPGEILLWIATPANAGSLQLWRTGPRHHTDWLCQRARQRHACWLPAEGLQAGRRRWGASENEIYAALGLRFIPPAERRLPPEALAGYELEPPMETA